LSNIFNHDLFLLQRGEYALQQYTEVKNVSILVGVVVSIAGHETYDHWLA